MASAIAIAADNSSNKPIRALWRQFANWEDNPSMCALGYIPHLTLAVCPDLNASQLWNCADGVRTEAVEIKFERLSYFESDPLVVWAAPSDPSAITSICRQLQANLPLEACAEHYRPETWTPHCTLGTEVTKEARNEAIDYCNSWNKPFSVRFDRYDCVTFPPVEVRYSRPL